MSYLSTEDINNFTDETLDKIYKEIPMVYASNYLQNMFKTIYYVLLNTYVITHVLNLM